MSHLRSNEGFLFLSHRGFSFIEDLVAKATKLGFKSFVLTSMPTAETTDRIVAISKIAHWSKCSAESSLREQDVRDAVDELRTQGFRVAGVVSVWEGYRLLAARANSWIGALDEEPATLGLLLDKLELRRSLGKLGLSSVTSSPLTAELLDLYRTESARKFVKPRRGLASFGAFRLSAELTMERIRELEEEMRGDADYRSIFAEPGDLFVAEDYIPGVEASFEAIVLEGETFVIAVHEKVEVDEADSTTLESACISPPVNLSGPQVEQGMRFLKSVFAGLGVQRGCFHVEMKFDPAGSRWEIIEINPRVGGAFINASVAALRPGTCLLELWLRLFAARDIDEKQLLMWELCSLSWKPADLDQPRRETFFRVYFGEPGRVIRGITKAKVSIEPKVVRLHAREGERLPDASREIFLAQALWSSETGELSAELDATLRLSRRMLEIQYEPQGLSATRAKALKTSVNKN